MADVTLTISSDPLVEIDLVGPGAAIAISMATAEAAIAVEHANIAVQAASDAQATLGYPLFADDPYVSYTITSVDQNGNILTGLDPQGQPMNVLPLWYPLFLDDPLVGSEGLIVDSAGNVMITSGASASEFTLFAPYVATDGTLHLASADSDYTVSHPISDIRNPVFDGSTLKWFDGDPTSFGATWREFDPAAADGIPDAITDVVFLPMLGQSNAVGFGTPATIITSAAISAGRVMMFNGGARPMQNDNTLNDDGTADTGLRPIKDTRLASLADLYEQLGGMANNRGETHGGGVGYWLASALPSTTLVIYGTFGVGGATIAKLSPGTYPWTNMLRAAERIKAWCDIKGVDLTVPALLWDQWEANSDDPDTTTYAPLLLGIQASFDTAMNTLVGTQAAARPVVFQQISSAGFYGVTDQSLAAHVLDSAIANPTLLVPNMPEYGLTFDDGAHLTDQSRRFAGEMLGRCLARFLAAQANKALYITAVANSGTTLTITTNAASQLVRSTSTVSDPGQYGLRLFKTSDDSEVTLSSIAVSGTNQITATMSGALSAGQSYYLGAGFRLTVGAGVNAGPTTGHRTCFRDSDAETASAAAGGANLYNRLMHQKKTFTAA
jgi:hypothetical protein